MKTRISPVLITIAFACFALVRSTQAVSPPPDGGYSGANTGEGQDALLSLTTGVHNTAVGFLSLKTVTNGSYNTAIGSGALLADSGEGNTATGTFALLNNTTGMLNTANGLLALSSNATGYCNTAVGCYALSSGGIHLINDTAVGFDALMNSTGNGNTAIGSNALAYDTTGEANTAVGGSALQRLDAPGNSNNIALGWFAGGNVFNGSNDIFIGNIGEDADQDTIRIGNQVTVTDINGIVHNRHVAAYIAGISEAGVSGTPVLISADGQLGVALSAVRFKEAIKPMDTASEAIFALNPVTFRYKEQFDPDRVPQFGLVAEEVEKVNPDLVARDEKGKPYTVRYEAVNAMLLNEFLKEHKKTEKLEATVASLIATVKEQAAQIQKVSVQLEMSKAAPQTVQNRQ